MVPESISYHISFRSTILVYYLVYFAIFTFQSIQQKYQKYLSYYLYQISLLQVAVKGLTTPLSCWLQGSWLFVQVLGDLRVVSYWIDTLVLKNRGKYLCYFAALPFPLQGKTNACSRGSMERRGPQPHGASIEAWRLLKCGRLRFPMLPRQPFNLTRPCCMQRKIIITCDCGGQRLASFCL